MTVTWSWGEAALHQLKMELAATSVIFPLTNEFVLPCVPNLFTYSPHFFFPPAFVLIILPYRVKENTGGKNPTFFSSKS